MKGITLLLALLFCSVGYSQSNNLKILADGFNSNNGQALYMIFKNSDGFPRNLDKAYRTGKMKIENGKATTDVKGLPDGVYAVIVVHDEDNNGQLKTNWIGMPREGVGNSNNPKGFPSFSKSSFTYNGKGFLRIAMVYL